MKENPDRKRKSNLSIRNTDSIHVSLLLYQVKLILENVFVISRLIPRSQFPSITLSKLSTE